MANIFDNVFKTLTKKCPQLVVPLINEVFGTNYNISEKVISLDKEYVDINDKKTNIFVDSMLQIRNSRYHLECQSTGDASMTLRMIKYDVRAAADDTDEINGEFVVRMPRSAVMYVRRRNGSKNLCPIRMILPDGKEVVYNIPVVFVDDYSLDTIISRNLLFFLPYFILRYEEDLKKFDADATIAKQIRDDFSLIYASLDDVLKQGVFNCDTVMTVLSLTGEILEYVGAKAANKNIIKEVIDMGGQVITMEYEKKQVKDLIEYNHDGYLSNEEIRQIAKKKGLLAVLEAELNKRN